MDLKNKLELIRRNTREIINENKIMELLKKGKKPIIYCGYETSGPIHLGHLVTIMKLIDLQKVGFDPKILFADWHTLLNKKGDWKFIHKEVKSWEKGFKAIGLKAKFILGSNFQRNLNYIDDVMELALDVTLNRGIRSMQGIARNIDNAKISQVVYPLMQVVDFKYLKVDGALGGLEQRKIHVLALEKLGKIGYKIPFLIHTPIISSLTGKGKMSSSVGESMISIKDSNKEIKDKINRAYCLQGDIKNNPILDIIRLIIFPAVSKFEIKRDKKFGGSIKFSNFEELEKSFADKKIHPLDLKNSCSKYLLEILDKIKNKF